MERRSAALAAIIVGWVTACREARNSKDRIVFGGTWLALITLLIVVVWNMVAAAATRHPGVAVAQAIGTPAGPTTSPLPDLTEAKRATSACSEIVAPRC